MRRLLWPGLVLLAFGIGMAIGWGGGGRIPLEPVSIATQPSVAALEARIDEMQQALAAKEAALVNLQQPALSRTKQSMPTTLMESSTRKAALPTIQEDNETSGETDTSSERSDTPEPHEVVWEQFYQFLEKTAGMSWGQRRRYEWALIADLRELGDPAVEALLQLLEESSDTRERSTAAFLLGSMQDQRAVAVLQEVLANEEDILMRRAAARGMARVQTPDTIPILDTILSNGLEDRYMRLSAAYGLARMGESQGIDGLASIFEESGADGRGHYMAFRALVATNDPRALPVMRQIVAAESEVSYRLGAISFLAAHGDREAIPLLQQVIESPDEQQSVREAAEQAMVAIGGGR